MRSLFYPSIIALVVTLIVQESFAELRQDTKSALNSDPEVVYREEITTENVKFRIKEEFPVFLTRDGKQKVGTSKVGTICELIGFDVRAFKIKGEAKHSRITGWISPHALECNDPQFKEHFQKLYERKMLVKELIEKQELAIGMTPIEVEQVLGLPSKTSVKTTAKGTSGLYEYIETVEKRHFDTIRDLDSGQFLRSYSHTTQELKNRIGVEFVDDAVSAIEKDEDNSVEGRVMRIVAAPIFVDWRDYIFR